MYAIIADGAHQYRVEEGLIFEVQRKDLPENTETIDFDRVLLIGGGEGGSAKVGTPTVSGAKVTAKVIGEIKGDKLIIQKMRRRKGYRLKQGHRQKHLRVQVEKIQG
ncbi:MAG: 50S ribosomal protein L21 [Phycisphaerae bacterium]